MLRYLQHGCIEIGSEQLAFHRQGIPQAAAHNAGTRRQFQHAVRFESRRPLRQVRRIAREDAKTQAQVVIFGDGPKKTRQVTTPGCLANKGWLFFRYNRQEE